MEEPRYLLPDDNNYVAGRANLSNFDIITDYGFDSVIVYRIVDDTLNSKKLGVLGSPSFYLYVLPVKKWGGPLHDLPDSIHSFYNKNSWVFSKNPNNSKAEVITFTITEDDLKP